MKRDAVQVVAVVDMEGEPIYKDTHDGPQPVTTTRRVQEDYAGAQLPKASRAEVLDAFKAWHAQAHKDEPETRAVWISDWLVRKAIQWTKDNPLGIVWYDARAVGERAAQLGANVCSAGNAGHAKILQLSQEPTPPSIFASSTSHGTGKNLQAWCNMLVFAPWAGGATWTQVLMARLITTVRDTFQYTF